MRFQDRITRSPRPFEPERGREAADAVPDLPPELREVLAGAGGSSPYLRGLIEREASWLAMALAGPPEEAREAILGALAGAGGTTLGAELRQAKRRMALLTALCDLAGVWPLEEVTGTLTRLADLALDRALAHEIARAATKGPLARIAADGGGEAGGGGDGGGGGGGAMGLVALAMGKMGAFELNYSSDIDLIVLFDETRFDGDDFLEVRSAFVRATRRAMALLSDVTPEGYVFRTDLRLRPDPAVTPVCLSMDAAERYYESVGRAWERAAYIKARPAAGDIAAGAAFLDRLRPFVWRRHLDYAAIQDAQDMRLKIRAHKRPGRAEALEGLNIKLCPGGIREIEFYTQTRQLIAGGRDPDLRDSGTVAALMALNAKGWSEDAEVLIADYRAHRELEHRLQMIGDQQTHSLPSNDEGFARLAALMGTGADALRRETAERLHRVAELTEGFFAPGEAARTPELDTRMQEIVDRWLNYPALRSARAREVFARVKPEILRRLDRAGQPQEALVHIDGFLAGLPAGVQVFSLFDANPQLIDLIVDVAATAPELARYLSRHSHVLDAVIGGAFFSDWPGREALAADLGAKLSLETDYEARLIAARRWRNEWHFRVGVHLLRGLVDAGAAGCQYADIAEAVLARIWPEVVADFARRHGPPPGRGAAILGMGSLGSRQLGPRSDLDLIVIYDPDGVESSDGRRPLPSQTYYARLTQAFLTALTAQMGPGRLYETDMRLRPSGRQGPVATTLAAFRSYQREKAWTWEHLALTRARPVAGAAALGDEIEALRREILAEPRDRGRVLADVADMRARLEGAKPGAGDWDAKSGPGRLQDIALLAQAGALLAGAPDRGVAEQIAAGSAALGLSPEDAEALVSVYGLFWSLQAITALIGSGAPIETETLGAGATRLILRETAAESIAALADRRDSLAARAGTIIDACLGGAVPIGDDA